MTKVTDGKLSTAAHPPASRQVLVSAEYTIPGMACMRQRLVSHLSHTATTLKQCNQMCPGGIPLSQSRQSATHIALRRSAPQHS